MPTPSKVRHFRNEQNKTEIFSRCACEDCTLSRSEDSLRHSRSRINAYRALASPSLIALSSKDPILTAFELSWELRQLAFAECEFKSEYLVSLAEFVKQNQYRSDIGILILVFILQ